MPSLKNLFHRNHQTTGVIDRDTTLEQFVFNFEPKTVGDRARVLLGCEYVIHELRQRMAHADFKEKRRLSQQLEFYEMELFKLSKKRYIPRQGEILRMKVLLGLKGQYPPRKGGSPGQFPNERIL